MGRLRRLSDGAIMRTFVRSSRIQAFKRPYRRDRSGDGRVERECRQKERGMGVEPAYETGLLMEGSVK